MSITCAQHRVAEHSGVDGQDKAQSPDVKKLAQDILQDHQQMDQQFKQVAQKTGVDLPQDLSQDMQQNIQTISQLQREEFDKQFASIVKASHAAAISRFGDEAKIAKNDDIKQFTTQQLPTLQKHGQAVMACAMAQGLGTENLGQAQPAGATFHPSDTSGGTSGTPDTPGSSTPEGSR